MAIAVLVLELLAIANPAPGDTLSETVRRYVRFTALGRVTMLPLCCWLAWHWLLRPRSDNSLSWKDLVAVGIGLGWAALEIARA